MHSIHKPDWHKNLTINQIESGYKPQTEWSISQSHNALQYINSSKLSVDKRNTRFVKKVMRLVMGLVSQLFIR